MRSVLNLRPRAARQSSSQEEAVEPAPFNDTNTVTLSLDLMGESEEEALLLVLFNDQVILETKWEDGVSLNPDVLQLDLSQPEDLCLATDTPVILILRTIVASKTPKKYEPMLHPDNKAGANIDILPIVLGQSELTINVPLVFIKTGKDTGLSLNATVKSEPAIQHDNVLVTLTMLSAHCMPTVKEGTAYLSALALDDLVDPAAVKFGMSQTPSDEDPINKLVWPNASALGHGAKTGYDFPDDDIFMESNLKCSDNCNNVHWKSVKRLLIDKEALRSRLETHFVIEIAAIPRTGKMELRGRYTGLVDAAVLLQPDQYGVTTSTRLIFYMEENKLPNVGSLLEVRTPQSGKASARSKHSKAETKEGFVYDEQGHSAFITMRFDLSEPLVENPNFNSLFEPLDIVIADDDESKLKEELQLEPSPEDPTIDVRRIRKECGALAVHRELSELASRGPMTMNQSIKRTAANRLLSRVRTMVKQFSPEECANIEWQETVTAHHAASRQAVTASFRPQPPRIRQSLNGASDAAMAGKKEIAQYYIERNVKLAPNQPRPILAKAIHCLELRHDTEARDLLMQAVKAHPKNRYLLWAFAAQEFNKDEDAAQKATAALTIAVKGDYSDGPTISIAWAALHTVHHYLKNEHAAFVAVREMRKAFELPINWKGFLKKWEESSGIKEVFYMPSSLEVDDPFVLAAAFFLSLRGYALAESLLQCYEQGCSVRGSRLGLELNLGPNIYYVRAASLLLRRHHDEALNMVNSGTLRFGPCAILSQIRLACLFAMNGWDEECETALIEAEKAGAECAALLMQAALAGMRSEPAVALQRAARAHKMASNAYTALTVGRVYSKLGERGLAERWAAAAVQLEPLLADGWAFLAGLALYRRDADKARAMLHTAKQAGEISPDLKEKIKTMISIVDARTLSHSLAKELCLCEWCGQEE
ncbi:unnamed protein product [Plutella xylostella]|uniref:(diamondback moth) hypothetical protein n=1 Tax=Plutella xylostella TaxID=51655 RepID=A0A8S4DCZ6_PLUXY|nr:unnamed protein product [Plutella xylostella]